MWNLLGFLTFKSTDNGGAKHNAVVLSIDEDVEASQVIKFEMSKKSLVEIYLKKYLLLIVTNIVFAAYKSMLIANFFNIIFLLICTCIF